MKIFKNIKQFKESFFSSNKNIIDKTVERGNEALRLYLIRLARKEAKLNELDLIEEKINRLIHELIYQLTNVEGYKNSLQLSTEDEYSYNFFKYLLTDYIYSSNILSAICRLEQYKCKKNNCNIEQVLLYDKLTEEYSSEVGIITNNNQVELMYRDLNLSIEKIQEGLRNNN